MRCDAMREREGDGVECTRVCSRVAFVAFVVVVVVVDDGRLLARARVDDLARRAG